MNLFKHVTTLMTDAQKQAQMLSGDPNLDYNIEELQKQYDVIGQIVNDSVKSTEQKNAVVSQIKNIMLQDAGYQTESQEPDARWKLINPLKIPSVVNYQDPSAFNNRIPSDVYNNIRNSYGATNIFDGINSAQIDSIARVNQFYRQRVQSQAYADALVRLGDRSSDPAQVFNIEPLRTPLHQLNTIHPLHTTEELKDATMEEQQVQQDNNLVDIEEEEKSKDVRTRTKAIAKEKRAGTRGRKNAPVENTINYNLSRMKRPELEGLSVRAQQQNSQVQSSNLIQILQQKPQQVDQQQTPHSQDEPTLLQFMQNVVKQSESSLQATLNKEMQPLIEQENTTRGQENAFINIMSQAENVYGPQMVDQNMQAADAAVRYDIVQDALSQLQEGREDRKMEAQEEEVKQSPPQREQVDEEMKEEGKIEDVQAEEMKQASENPPGQISYSQFRLDDDAKKVIQEQIATSLEAHQDSAQVKSAIKAQINLLLKDVTKGIETNVESNNKGIYTKINQLQMLIASDKRENEAESNRISEKLDELRTTTAAANGITKADLNAQIKEMNEMKKALKYRDNQAQSLSDKVVKLQADMINNEAQQKSVLANELVQKTLEGMADMEETMRKEVSTLIGAQLTKAEKASTVLDERIQKQLVDIQKQIGKAVSGKELQELKSLVDEVKKESVKIKNTPSDLAAFKKEVNDKTKKLEAQIKEVKLFDLDRPNKRQRQIGRQMSEERVFDSSAPGFVDRNGALTQLGRSNLIGATLHNASSQAVREMKREIAETKKFDTFRKQIQETVNKIKEDFKQPEGSKEHSDAMKNEKILVTLAQTVMKERAAVFEQTKLQHQQIMDEAEKTIQSQKEQALSQIEIAKLKARLDKGNNQMANDSEALKNEEIRQRMAMSQNKFGLQQQAFAADQEKARQNTNLLLGSQQETRAKIEADRESKRLDTALTYQDRQNKHVEKLTALNTQIQAKFALAQGKYDADNEIRNRTLQDQLDNTRAKFDNDLALLGLNLQFKRDAKKGIIDQEITTAKDELAAKVTTQKAKLESEAALQKDRLAHEASIQQKDLAAKTAQQKQQLDTELETQQLKKEIQQMKNEKTYKRLETQAEVDKNIEEMKYKREYTLKELEQQFQERVTERAYTHELNKGLMNLRAKREEAIDEVFQQYRQTIKANQKYNDGKVEASVFRRYATMKDSLDQIPGHPADSLIEGNFNHNLPAKFNPASVNPSFRTLLSQAQNPAGISSAGLNSLANEIASYGDKMREEYKKVSDLENSPQGDEIFFNILQTGTPEDVSLEGLNKESMKMLRLGSQMLIRGKKQMDSGRFIDGSTKLHYRLLPLAIDNLLKFEVDGGTEQRKYMDGLRELRRDLIAASEKATAFNDRLSEYYDASVQTGKNDAYRRAEQLDRQIRRDEYRSNEETKAMFRMKEQISTGIETVLKKMGLDKLGPASDKPLPNQNAPFNQGQYQRMKDEQQLGYSRASQFSNQGYGGKYGRRDYVKDRVTDAFMDRRNQQSTDQSDVSGPTRMKAGRQLLELGNRARNLTHEDVALLSKIVIDKRSGKIMKIGEEGELEELDDEENEKAAMIVIEVLLYIYTKYVGDVSFDQIEEYKDLLKEEYVDDTRTGDPNLQPLMRTANVLADKIIGGTYKSSTIQKYIEDLMNALKTEEDDDEDGDKKMKDEKEEEDQKKKAMPPPPSKKQRVV